ncbi:cleavage and polyadenylation specificity factor subunit 4-like [Procambarus clarkii]|uniref:cleavage and polyadenylation specificity factor subunit 4 n=1 Tax=Procambarus clarkii TaxID=6728 RepID=UPI001E673EA5|nr:cleavage and polyadenylation specificity factor subunit 4-like [Procambarus clarkii]
MMEVIVANVDKITFDIETQLEEQVGAQMLPFPGMDKSIAAVCTFYMRGNCSKSVNCPFRHVRGDRTVVCKHWLRGLCKKGDQCEFLHEYDMSKMPECYFYSRFNACHNKECPFLHINPDMKMKDCPWYDRGFCRHGPQCRNRHVRRVLCMNYFSGFCPDGSGCKFMHPRFELPQIMEDKQLPHKKQGITCHYCGEAGHKASHCYKANPELREQNAIISLASGGPRNQPGKENSGPPPMHQMDNNRLDNVICFKCGQQGHFANRCSKGQFAFLSSSN